MMLTLQRNWKKVLLVVVLIPPVWISFVMVFMLSYGYWGIPPFQISDGTKLPVTLQEAFAADERLQADCEVWQIEGLPDRKCVWLIRGHSDYVEQFIQSKRLEITDSRHVRAKMLQERVRTDWPKVDFQTWEWFSTAKYGKEHLEGQDLFLVATNSDRSISIVFYEWIF